MKKGIDVSKWQGAIDWKKVKASGIEFAMLRACVTSKGTTSVDKFFETNYKNAKAVGMPIGAYLYSQATSVADAEKEADFLIKTLKGKQLEFPIAFDIEDEKQKILTRERATEITTAFCNRVEKAGYYVCIYSMKSWLTDKLLMNKLTRFDVWVAQWNKECTYKGNYGMWQYSDSGKVNGIDGNVDLDYAYKDYASIIKKAGLNGFSKAAAKPAEKPASKPVEKPATKPKEKAEKKYVKGSRIVLLNKPIYSSAYTKVASGTKTGIYYIYDGEKINGRYRITTAKKLCGKKPTYQYVTGWIEL